jgi:GTP cyclohydrolase I
MRMLYDVSIMQELTRDLLAKIGEDPDREGLKKTPERFDKAIRFLTSGYRQDPREVLQRAIFHESYDEMVIVKDLDVFSLCEHHILPFFGKCHVAYIPKKKIVGLSKIARVVELYSHRLQVQERLTQEIATAIMDTLQPHGVAVVIEAFHLCMMMRGIEKQNAKAVTSAMLGVFRTRQSTRMEFMELIKPSLNILR